MLELLLVLTGLIGFVLLGYLTLVVTPGIMVEFGLWVLAAGLVIGIPTGLWYHVVLYRTLARHITLPKGWWRRPAELHPRLTTDEFRPILPWFVSGAIGFVLCVIGGVAAIAGLSIARFYP